MSDKFQEIREQIARYREYADSERLCGVDAGRTGRCSVYWAWDDAADTLQSLLEAAEASEKLQADMIMRADIGTWDGDKTVQAGATVWAVFCDALANLEQSDG